MANYTWDLSTDIASGKLSTHAALPAVNVTTTGDNWTINAKKDTASTIEIDDVNKPQSVVFNGSTKVDTVTVDALSAKDATATINTGADNDVINLAAGAKATVNAGAGTDTINVAATATAIIDGGAGVDTIALTGVATATVAYDATDIITSTAGTAEVTLDATSAATAVNWNLTKAINAVGATDAIVLGTSTLVVGEIKKVIGTTLADTLTAGATAVTLDGGAGADTLIATAAGTTFVYDAADTKVTGSASTLTAAGKTTAMNLSLENNTVFTGIASVIGSDVADDVHGTGAVTIAGGKGNDLIWGGATASITGTNTFGDNTLTGGAGADEFWIGYNEGNDTITYDAGTAATADDSKNDTVHLYNVSAYDIIGENVFTNDGATGTIKYASLANGNSNTLTLTGAATNNTNAVRHFTSQEGWSFDVAFAATADTKLTGTAGVTDNLVAAAGVAVTLDGQGGNDNLYGSSVGDTFVFHAGDQIYSGGGTDTIDASQATEGATIFTADVLAGTTAATNWTINGSKFDDNIRGTAVIDTIVAGDGNDAIWGGAGVVADTLTGGRGVDTYYYGLDEGNDTITAGGSKYDGNALDTVNFYNVAKTDDLSAAISGNDLVISVTGAQGVGTLTIGGWATTTDTLNKLTNVVVADTNYTMGYDTATAKVTFTKTVA